jgi:hypothetical protein
LTDHGQRSTALLIELQTFFSLVSGEKADNQKKLFGMRPFLFFGGCISFFLSNEKEISTILKYV